MSLNIFFSPDADNVLSSYMNVSCENVQTTEVKIESDELFSAEIITSMVDNNSIQDKFVLESMKCF